MKAKIILIFGASGSGKSTLCSELEGIDTFSIHRKGSTRPVRQYDGREIIHVEEEQLRQQYEYIYSRYGFLYGMQKSQIEVAIQEEKIHVAICNDVDVIEKIKSVYKELVKVVYLLFDAPKRVTVYT